MKHKMDEETAYAIKAIVVVVILALLFIFAMAIVGERISHYMNDSRCESACEKLERGFLYYHFYDGCFCIKEGTGSKIVQGE